MVRRFLVTSSVIVSLAVWSLPSAQKVGGPNTAAAPAVGRHGMVSTAHPLATQAGLDILQEGGNAFDAAVAVAATLNVVEPMMSGIGGYGTIVVYDAKTGRSRFLDSSGRIPKALDSDVFRAPTPNYRENRRGPKSISTPGNVNAWAAMSKEYGVLPWNRLFQTAVSLADGGFVLDDRTASMIGGAFGGFSAYTKGFYGKDGRPLSAGDRLVQKDLAKSFRTIAAQGAGAVYGGELGVSIDKAMREAGSFLRLDDLANAKAEWWEPIRIRYRGYEIVTASPPANSFPFLIRMGMMSRFDVKGMGHNSARYLHTFAEVTKHAFWCRLKYAGDPEIEPPPLDRLLSEAYWKEEAGRIDPDRAKDFVYPGPETPDAMNTTHFVVADSLGNIVSATQTLGNVFGSRVMPEGTGIFLNNSLAYCTFEPKGNPMDAYPGRRKLSGDCPALVLRDGKPVIAIGTPGGHTIGQTVPQMLMNLLDFGMDIQQAIAAPRISFVEPNDLTVERGIPEGVREALAAKGHHLRTGSLGDGHGLTIEYDESGRPVRFTGGSDPRGAGLAKGY